MNEAQTIRDLLEAKTIAVVGLSADPDKPSYFVSEYMQQHGYRIIPVNPSLANVLGEKSYPSLSDLPKRPDLVNVFRAAPVIPRIVAEMELLGLNGLWVQQGIVNLGAVERAETSGMRVVMDHCIMIEHRKMKSS